MGDLGFTLKHLRLPGEKTPASLGSPTPLAILPSLFSWMRGRRVVDRGAGVFPAFSPAPVNLIVGNPTLAETIAERDAAIAEMNALIDERFGITNCPNCGLKVAVLVDGVCRDCQPEDAA